METLTRHLSGIRRWSWLAALALHATAGPVGGAGPLPDPRPPQVLAIDQLPSPRAVLLPPVENESTAPAPTPQSCGVAGGAELSVAVLVEQVLARNPSLAQMQAAYEAASARYPQVTSLDDPMLGLTGSPTAIGDSALANRGYRIDLAQKLPFPGKLGLRGAGARAEAHAAASDVDDMRLQLVESARSAFFDYYLVDRALAVSAESLRLLRDFKQNAEGRYRTGLVSQQDILQAELEIGRQQERQAELEQLQRIALARLNTLMHLPPDSPLPPPPRRLPLAGPLPAPEVLRHAAVASRPDLHALASRLQAEEAALGLAHKEFYPDVEVGGAYDTYWAERPQQWQLSLKMNLPVRQARRHGAVAEALARVAQRRAELARETDRVNFQVQEAYEQVRKGERVVRLYEATILPAAEANVKAAQAAYVTGKVPFLSLIEAQRSVVGLRDRYYEAVADYFRRRAALDRATGGALCGGGNFRDGDRRR